LPAAEISELYKYWQLFYSALYQRLNLCPRIEIDAGNVTNVSEVEFNDLCQGLSDRINIWLNSESFRNIDQRLRTQLNSFDEIRSLLKLTITCYVGCLGSYGTSLSIIKGGSGIECFGIWTNTKAPTKPPGAKLES